MDCVTHPTRYENTCCNRQRHKTVRSLLRLALNRNFSSMLVSDPIVDR